MPSCPKPEPRVEDPAYRLWVPENYPCAVAGREIHPGCGHYHTCEGRLEFAHIRARSLRGSDLGNGVSLCTLAHTGALWSLHRDGEDSFARRFKIDLPALAKLIGDEYTGRVWT